MSRLSEASSDADSGASVPIFFISAPFPPARKESCCPEETVEQSRFVLIFHSFGLRTGTSAYAHEDFSGQLVEGEEKRLLQYG